MRQLAVPVNGSGESCPGESGRVWVARRRSRPGM